jgi:hypothetical protein
MLRVIGSSGLPASAQPPAASKCGIPLFFLERYDFAPAAAAAGSADLMRSSRSSSWPRPSAAAGFRITGQSFTTLCTEHCVFQVVFPGKSGQL